MIKKCFLLLFCIFILPGCNPKNSKIDIVKSKVIPTSNQIAYQRQEIIGFVHFGMNTFTDKEWGFGDENPRIFNPSKLDAEQWAKAAKEGGLKELILVAKHHDGFCLWPSKYTEHSIKNSPYKNGKGDIVKEFVDACRKHGLKVGLYLSPWDRNHKDYGKPEYIEYYRNQLTELLTNYGEITEIWFDGANGGDGYYGGTRETRKIDRSTYYDWPTTIALAKKLQPNILIFSDAGPDIHWIGNENGFAGETFWSTIDDSKLVIGNSDMNYLNTGDLNGNKWIVGQCDVSIRPGWFYHEKEDSLVKTPQQLFDIYLKSVGRNSILLINIPPNKNGLFNTIDIENLKGLNVIIQKTFETNLATGKPVIASNTKSNSKNYAPENLLDNNTSTVWTTENNYLSAEIIIKIGSSTKIDIIELKEAIEYGQRISKFQVLARVDGIWTPITSGTTVGLRRILKFETVNADEIKIEILDAFNSPVLSGVGVYNSLTIE